MYTVIETPAFQKQLAKIWSPDDMTDLKNIDIDIDKVAKAVERDAGQALPGLRESLAQAQRGEYARVHTPELIASRGRGRPVQASTKQAVKLRLDPDLLVALRASGRGWQTQVNALLRREFLDA